MIARRYRLEDEIGSGAGGVVWSALDTKLNRTVALKRPHGVRGAAERTQFRREAENAAQLHHPNVVSIFDIVDTDGCWLVLEYLPARGLDAVLADEGPLPPDRVIRIGAQLAAALHAAHAKGIVHRDVKPGNVLVTGTGLAKLADFGVSVWQDVTLTEDGKISGTAAYVAPEVADGRAATRASDVFSLGATLFAAVEGTPPFGTGDPDAVLARARRGRIPEMHRAGPLAAVLSDLLETRPGRRPTAEQARQRLMEIAGDWEPAPGQDPLPRSWWRRPAVYRAVTMAALAAVAVFAAWNWLVPGAAPEPPAGQGGPVQPSASSTPVQPGVIGDPRTADPCSLANQSALRRFGGTELDPQYGNFNRCDVLVDTGGEEPVDVEIELAVADPPHPVRPGVFTVERHPRSDDACDRRVPVADDYDLWVTTKVDDPTVDLCAMADAATTSAVARLRKGPLSPRAPFDPASLANADACALLDGKALARLPGVDAVHPKIGFGNWDCRWDSTLDETGLHILFDHSQPPSADDGTPTRVSSHAAFVQADDYQDRSCSVKVVHRQISDQGGNPLDEMLIVIVSGDKPGQRFCPMATDFARAAAAKLPR